MRKSGLLLASMALALLLVSGVAWAVTKNCRAGADFCVGTNGSDTLNGSEERDKIFGLDANDRLRGNDGNDTLLGGADNDTLSGGLGEDTMWYTQTQGEDQIYGGPHGDQIRDDSYTYDRQSDTYRSDRNLLSGGGGNDNMYGHNKLDGGPGDDQVQGSHNTDSARWNSGTRTITGGPGNDRLSSGGNIEDTFYARDGERDTVSCGGGEDTVYFDKGMDSVNPVNCEKRIGK